MTGQQISDGQIMMIQSQKVQQLFALVLSVHGFAGSHKLDSQLSTILSRLLIESPAIYTPVNHYVAKFLLSHNHSTLENEWFQ